MHSPAARLLIARTRELNIPSALVTECLQALREYEAGAGDRESLRRWIEARVPGVWSEVERLL